MLSKGIAYVILCLATTQAVKNEDRTFSAVVVEYSPPMDPTLDPITNVLNNVDTYVDFITLANDKYQVDIIVFPEVGLRGYLNQKVFLEVPDPKDSVRPCARDTQYEAVGEVSRYIPGEEIVSEGSSINGDDDLVIPKELLWEASTIDPPIVQLSCAARVAATYVVVNLEERFFNATEQRTIYFNTDVVFDREGTVVARYRKIHLFEEGMLQSPVGKELAYFDTDFGVRFGLLTCFDIIFEDPGVVLAKKYNVSHFIFPTAWFSEMPFLTAIQEQNYWAYTLDVVLLAAGYNMPTSGSTGSGIYLGRKGPVIYNMTEDTGSFMLHAQLPKQRSGDLNLSPTSPGQLLFEKDDTRNAGYVTRPKIYSSELKLKRDFLDVYSTELITIPDAAKRILIGSDVIIPFNIDKTICHNDLCCNFSLVVTVTFNKSRYSQESRNDDYSELYYRLAAFDGVRHYDHVDTGGLQTCALLPCVNTDLASCGLPPHDSSSKPNTLLDLYQTKFIFESIKITGNFSNNNSFVGPNVLVGGEYNNFGALLDPETFRFTVDNITDMVVVNTFQTIEPVTNLVTASVYARLFFKDGQDYTGDVTPKYSSGCSLCFIASVMVASLLFIKYNSHTN